MTHKANVFISITRPWFSYNLSMLRIVHLHRLLYYISVTGLYSHDRMTLMCWTDFIITSPNFAGTMKLAIVSIYIEK